MTVSVRGLTLVSTTYSHIFDQILKLVSAVAKRKNFDGTLLANRLDIYYFTYQSKQQRSISIDLVNTLVSPTSFSYISTVIIYL